MSHQSAVSSDSSRSINLNSQVLRGLAILSIILHNYTHWMHGAIFENEFTYQAWHVSKLLNYLSNPDGRLPLQLLSFFGHYGVVIFVFLSAYGLEKKYGRSTKEVRPLPFIWTHYLKLLSMCIVGYAAYLLLNTFYISYPASTIFGVLSQLTMLCNLQICSFDTFAPGPYWYFGLMLELYVVYRLLLFRHSWSVIVGAILVCSIAQAFVTPDGAVMTWLRTNFVGSILPFGLGLLYARYEESLQLSKTAYGVIALVSIALIFVTSLSFLPWIATPIFVCTLGISCIQLLPKSMNAPIAWVGGVSAAIFVSHPIVRQLGLALAEKLHLSPYLSVFTFLIGALLVGAIFQPILDRSAKLFMKLAKH